MLFPPAAFIPYFEALLANGGNAPTTGSAASWSQAVNNSAAPYAPQRKWTVVGGSYAGALVTWFTVSAAASVTRQCGDRAAVGGAAVHHNEHECLPAS